VPPQGTKGTIAESRNAETTKPQGVLVPRPDVRITSAINRIYTGFSTYFPLASFLSPLP
jgi:hypothetical protein